LLARIASFLKKPVFSYAPHYERWIERTAPAQLSQIRSNFKRIEGRGASSDSTPQGSRDIPAKAGDPLQFHEPAQTGKIDWYE
jgi:hypothetical protein